MLLLRVRGRIIGGQPSTMIKVSLFDTSQIFWPRFTITKCIKKALRGN